jgi:hypothetical protein
MCMYVAVVLCSQSHLTSDLVSFRFVSFRFVSFRFVSFRTVLRCAALPTPWCVVFAADGEAGCSMCY